MGNDLLHTDNRAGTTERGTPQDVDSRYQKTFEAARNANVDLIAAAREMAPVDVLMMPGNHDTLGVWHLGDSLRIWFQRFSDISVDNGPTPRRESRGESREQATTFRASGLGCLPSPRRFHLRSADPGRSYSLYNPGSPTLHNPLLQIVVKIKLIRHGPQVDLLQLDFALVADPGIDHVLREHVAAQQELVVVLEGIQHIAQ